MPYIIGSACTGKETACVDVCPVDCIYPKKRVSAEATAFYINSDECTDCGACALVCREKAIFPVAGNGWYEEKPHPVANQVVKAKLTLHAGEANEKDVTVTVEIPGDKVILNGRVESWAQLMASMSD